MDIVRDLLDKPVVDRNGREMGRVDGVKLILQDGDRPTVRAIEIGPTVLASRLAPAAGRLARRLEQFFGVGRDRPVEIPVRDVEIGERITIRRTMGETAANAVELKLRSLYRVWK
jgi:sporulation protein YlmC with PRC-barrel domain